MTTIIVNSGTTSVSTAIPTTSNYLVEGSGTLDILNGGVVAGTIISAGGSENVFPGGIDSSATVSSGGVEIVSRGTAYPVSFSLSKM